MFINKNAYLTVCVMFMLWPLESQPMASPDEDAGRPEAHEFLLPYIVISLGNCCRTAYYIRETGLNSFSYPFDWFVTSCRTVRKAIKRNFKDYILPGNLEDVNFFDSTLNIHVDPQPNRYVHDKYYDFQSRHDFPAHLPITPELAQEVYNKYQRRIARFYRAITVATKKESGKADKHIYFVRRCITKKEAEKLNKTIQKKFPRLSYTLIALDHREEAKHRWHIPNVKNIYFDNPTYRFNDLTQSYKYEPTVKLAEWKGIMERVLRRGGFVMQGAYPTFSERKEQPSN